MKNSMYNFLIPNDDTSENKYTTTLMLDEVPSEVAYDILTESLKNGEVLTKEELKKRIDLRESKINITFDEFTKYIINRVEQYTNERVEPEIYFEPKPTRSPVMEQHKISPWIVNPDNPQEEIRICTECGMKMSRREVQNYNYEDIERELGEDKQESTYEKNKDYQNNSNGYESDEVNVGRSL